MKKAKNVYVSAHPYIILRKFICVIMLRRLCEGSQLFFYEDHG